MSDEPLFHRVLKATEAGLPLVARPYHEVARQLGVSVEAVMSVFHEALKSGTVRRIAAVPNHYRAGVTANAMTVWNVDDTVVDELGAKVGALECVSHCYRRPRHEPVWPYNLFAMVHGKTREECLAKRDRIAEILGSHCQGADVLFSKRILKKTGFRSADATGKNA